MSDVVLPRMSGRVIAERIGGMREGIKVLLMSGYTDEALLQHGILESDVALAKATHARRLGAQVRLVLDS